MISTIFLEFNFALIVMVAIVVEFIRGFSFLCSSSSENITVFRGKKIVIDRDG